jgi:hypothetical protein
MGGRGSGGGGSHRPVPPSDDDELPVQPLEIRELRQQLQRPLQDLLELSRTEVIVDRTAHRKITSGHPLDAPYLNRLPELFDGWILAGISPKHSSRLEIYCRIDGIWFTVVVRADPELGASFLVTLHRLYARKVASRERKGYLIRRKE